MREEATSRRCGFAGDSTRMCTVWRKHRNVTGHILQERTEKEALKIYLARYGTLQEAITRIEEDRKADGGLLYLEFARKVNQHQKVMSLW